MAILDEITPKYYEVLNLTMQRQDGEVVATYQIMIRNVLGNPRRIINQGSVLTSQEKAAVVAIFQRDKAQFEAATGLEEWVEPEESPDAIRARADEVALLAGIAIDIVAEAAERIKDENHA